MRNFNCHYYTFKVTITKNDKVEFNFIKATSACWSNLKQILGDKEVKDIYIDKFRDGKTESCIPNLISLVNMITPCELVKLGGIEFIKFTFLSRDYDKNLVLLNFIRTLWYNNRGIGKIPRFNIEQFIELINNVDIEKVRRARKYDALYILMKIYKKCCHVNASTINNHDNVCYKINPKPLSEFLKIKDGTQVSGLMR